MPRTVALYKDDIARGRRTKIFLTLILPHKKAQAAEEIHTSMSLEH